MTIRAAMAAAMILSLTTAALAEEGPLRHRQGDDELRSDWLIGATVTTPEDALIGQIQGLLVDRDDGRITAAIVSVGGIFGIGAKDIAVAWDEIEINYDAREIRLELSREEAKAAPEFRFRRQQTLPGQ